MQIKLNQNRILRQTGVKQVDYTKKRNRKKLILRRFAYVGNVPAFVRSIFRATN